MSFPSFPTPGAKPKKKRPVKKLQLSIEEINNRYDLRRETITWMNRLEPYHPYILGSLARGDVFGTSARFIIEPSSPVDKVEELLLKQWTSRGLLQETEFDAPKIVYTFKKEKPKIELVSQCFLPLTNLSTREIDAMNFFGRKSLIKYRNGDYAIGVNNNLYLVESLDQKAYSFSLTPITNFKIHELGKKVNASVNSVMEQTKNIRSWRKAGKKPDYRINRTLYPGDDPYTVLDHLAENDAKLRKIMRKNGYS